jgi:hypothetical protein
LSCARVGASPRSSELRDRRTTDPKVEHLGQRLVSIGDARKADVYVAEGSDKVFLKNVHLRSPTPIDSALFFVTQLENASAAEFDICTSCSSTICSACRCTSTWLRIAHLVARCAGVSSWC